MPKENEPKTTSEFLDRLSEFLGEPMDEPLDILQARLKEEGLQPEQILDRIHRLAVEKFEEARLAWQIKAREERLAAAAQLKDVGLAARMTREECLGRIRTLLSGLRGDQFALAQVRHRKFEVMTDNDLQSLLEDLEGSVALSGEK